MVPIFGKKFKRTMAFILIFMMVFSTPTMALGSDLDLGGIDQGDNLGGDSPGGGDDPVDPDPVDPDPVDPDPVDPDPVDPDPVDPDPVDPDPVDPDPVDPDPVDPDPVDPDPVDPDAPTGQLGPVDYNLNVMPELLMMPVMMAVPLSIEIGTPEFYSTGWPEDMIVGKLASNNGRETIAFGEDWEVWVESNNNKGVVTWQIKAKGDFPEDGFNITLYIQVKLKEDKGNSTNTYTATLNVTGTGEVLAKDVIDGYFGNKEFSINKVGWGISADPPPPSLGSITINKTFDTGKGISKADTFYFNVYDSNGEPIWEAYPITTNTDGFGSNTIPNLPAGDYRVVEVDENGIPLKSGVDYNITISAGSQTVEDSEITVTVADENVNVNVTNKVVPTYKFTLKKTVEGLPKDKQMTSVTFLVNGKEYKVPISYDRNGTGSGSTEIWLPKGDYTVFEQIPSVEVKDYQRVTTVNGYPYNEQNGAKVTVTGNERNDKIKFENCYTASGDLIIKKLVKNENGEDLKVSTDTEFYFRITNTKTGQVIHKAYPVTVNVNQSSATATVKDLPYGEYKVTEVDKGGNKLDTQAFGYTVEGNGQTVKINKDCKQPTVTVTNKKQPSGALTIKKVVKGEDNPEGIFWFKVTGSNNYKQWRSINVGEGETEVVIDNLPFGDYKVQEVSGNGSNELGRNFGYEVSIKADKGKEQAGSQITVELKAKDRNAVVTVINTLKPDTGKLKIEKKVTGLGRGLTKGQDTGEFWFRITSLDDPEYVFVVSVPTSYKDGFGYGSVTQTLPSGKYQVEELSGENGTVVNVNGTFNVTVDSSTYSYQLQSLADDSGKNNKDGIVEVKQDKKVSATVTATNKRLEEVQPKGSLIIEKVISVPDGVTAPDQTFYFVVVKAGDADRKVFLTTKNGTNYLELEDLDYGDYTVYETDSTYTNRINDGKTITVGEFTYTVSYGQTGNKVTVGELEEGAALPKVTVTNTLDQGEEPETIRLSVEKEWRGGTEAGIPESITFYLTINRERTEHSLTLTAEDDWFGTFEGEFPVKDDNGNVIEYGVYEVPVANYVRSDENAPNDNNVFEVVNTYQQPGATSGTLYLVKRLAGSWTANDTFRFLVEGPNGYSNIFDVATVNGTGSITLSNLAFGAYTVTEVGAANGSLTQNGVTYDVAVSANGQTTLSEQGQTAATITVTNTVPGGGGGGGGSTGRDRDETTGGTTDPLTDIDGVNVPLGTYNDSSIPEPNETEEVDEVDELEEIEDPNVPLSNMPKTGVSDYLTLWLLGLCASLGLVAVLLRSKRKQEQE